MQAYQSEPHQVFVFLASRWILIPLRTELLMHLLLIASDKCVDTLLLVSVGFAEVLGIPGLDAEELGYRKALDEKSRGG